MEVDGGVDVDVDVGVDVDVDMDVDVDVFVDVGEDPRCLPLYLLALTHIPSLTRP